MTSAMASMHVRLAPRIGVAAMLAVFASACAHAATFKVLVIAPQDDARLARNRVERAYFGHATGPAIDGIQVAVDEARLELETEGASLVIETAAASDAKSAADAAAKAEKAGIAAIVTDLDVLSTAAVAQAVKLPVINVGEADDRLREADCRANLLHVAPSERMRADAIAQSLISRKWANVLLLAGPSEADVRRAKVAQASIQRYGLKLTGTKNFKISNDPRERDLANPLLLTNPSSSGGAYDVVWVVDSDGEFARSLPYRTSLPRPVVGDAGLTALSWHDQYERYGAPQVTRRFARGAKRPMGANDWQAWIAGKALAAAAAAAAKGPTAAFQKALYAVEVDGSKGIGMTFREWDGQLRQPLLMTDGQGVISAAPVEGILHPKNTLDTLGNDAPEKKCKSRT
jgi:ABC transporter substrate binding protein (PQQ-dependent alcohol dehydrogenase system)